MLRALADELLALVVPPACLACRRPLARAGEVLCAPCRRGLPWLPEPPCPRCALPAPCRPCPAARPPPAQAVLVDDVHTTGATLRAGAAALRAAGAERVVCVTYARALRRG